MQLAEVGAPLKRARMTMGLSQEQLASPLGMSRSTISAIEGRRCEEIGFNKLVALLDAVGIEVTLRPRTGRPTLDELREERRTR
jgi:transcriptional regulator with XRE-family HTH domain